MILARALIRYLENVWAGQNDPDENAQQSLPEAIKTLAAKVALEILPHKGLQEVKPERVVESVEQWEKKAQESDPVWKETSETIAEELSSATQVSTDGERRLGVFRYLLELQMAVQCIAFGLVQSALGASN